MTLVDGLERQLNDLRLALRRLRKAPTVVVVALVTLALGIGVNAAVFTLTDAVLLTSLPVRQPSELVSLGDDVLNGDTTSIQDSLTLYSYPLYRQVRAHLTGVREVAAFQSWLATISARRVGVDEQPRSAKAEYVSGNYFATLGTDPALGRLLSDEDDRPGSRAAAVVSYAAWVRGGQDRTIVGATLAINGVPATIVGVAAPGFFGETLRADPPDYWLPLSLEPATTRDNPLLQEESVFWLYTLARVPAGTSLEPLQAEITRDVRQWILDRHLFGDRDRPRIDAMRVVVTPASAGIGGLRNEYGDGLKLLSVLSAFVLAIACMNIASLLMARGAGRRAEFAVRMALGTSRGRLVSDTMTEGLLLALAGGAAGWLVQAAVTPVIVALARHGHDAAPLPAGSSARLVAYMVTLAIAAGLLFSSVPAWRSADLRAGEALRGAGRVARDAVSRPLRWLIACQTAFSLVLIIGAGLLTTSLRGLERQSLGFTRNQVVIVGVNPALDGYTAEKLPALYRKLDERLPRIPGVQSASYSLHAPLDEWNWGMRVQFDGLPPPADPTANRAWYTRVSAHYFGTLGTQLRRGRAIDERDTATSARIAVVNEAFVTQFLSNTVPIGRRFGSISAGHGRDFEIVGVVENAKYRDVRKPDDPMFFLPLTQTVAYDTPVLASYQRWSMFIDGIQLRVADSVSLARPTIEQAMREVDPNLTILHVRPLNEYVDFQLKSPRLLASLTTFYGVLALLLACVGLYGVTAYAVARRSRDWGVCLALGASRARVMGSVCREALRPVVGGVLVGVPAAVAGAHAIANQLFGVNDSQTLIVGAAVLALGTCAVAAAIGPARRAATVDPLAVIRAD
jgi:predicted permease